MSLVKRTEAEVMAMLERRYRGDDRGNGPAWAFIPKVRNAAGFDGNRTADAIAMSLWKSRGLELHGFEIKCDRRDWLRELRDPAKAETFIALCDRWWVVAGDDSIVQDGELPPGWGLLVARTGSRLTVAVPAASQEIGEAPFTKAGRSFLAALLRSAARTQEATPEEIRVAIDAALEQHQEAREAAATRHRAEVEELRTRIRTFEEESGVMLAHANPEYRWHGQRTPQDVGAALRLVLSGEADTELFERRLRTIRETAGRLVEDLDRALGDAA